jgi:raffinose/stachyose/melibiose transport system permease protein
VSLAGRASARPAGLRPGGPVGTARSRRKWYEIIGFTGPAFIVFTIFVLAPMGFAVYYSLYKWSGYGWPTEFRGLDNYFGEYGAFKDPIFLDALKNNAIISSGHCWCRALWRSASRCCSTGSSAAAPAFRLLVFIPYVLAEVTVGIMWQLLLLRDGTVNTLLSDIGLGWLTTGWLANLPVVIWAMLFILTWKYVGFALILFLAGLANIPDELTEAASIDGASWWQIQRHVVIPMLGSTIRIWEFLSMIGSLQVFDVIWVASTPAVRSLGASNTMATYMVDHGFNQREWGYGNAVAVILFCIAFVAALLFQRFVLSRDIDGALTTTAKGEELTWPRLLRYRLPAAATGQVGQPARLRPGARGRRGYRSAPVVYVILGGFRTTGQIAADPAALPHPWVWSTYANVIAQPTFWSQLLNSTIIAASTTLAVVAAGRLCGVRARALSVPRAGGLYTYFTIGLLFPAAAASSRSTCCCGILGLADSYLGVIIPQVAFQLPLTIVILRPSWPRSPLELEDARRSTAPTGSASSGGFLLPLSRPALVTVAVLAFVASWNSFLLPCSSSRTRACTPCPWECRTSRPSTVRTPLESSPSRHWQ